MLSALRWARTSRAWISRRSARSCFWTRPRRRRPGRLGILTREHHSLEFPLKGSCPSVTSMDRCWHGLRSYLAPPPDHRQDGTARKPSQRYAA